MSWPNLSLPVHFCPYLLKRPQNHVRLASKGQSFGSYSLGQPVVVYTGDGWKKGKVIQKRSHCIAIWLDKMETGDFPRWVHDPRNCLPVSN